MNISWDDARIFLAVAETGSFSDAARRLQLGQPTVSRRIAEYEYQLGQPLFHRGRRGTTLTAEGTRLMEPARQMARWAAELERAAAGQENAATGRVRLAAPPGVAYDFLVPFSAAFKQTQPGIQLEIRSSIHYLDLARGDAELAIRSRPPTEASLTLLYELRAPVAVFASAAYLATLPTPCKPSDVGWICWSEPYLHLSPRPELEALIDGFEPVFASDNFLVQYQACRLGLGAMFLSKVTHPLIADHGLKEVPLPLPPVQDSSYLVCPKSMEYVPRVRAVIKALCAVFDQIQSP